MSLKSSTEAQASTTPAEALLFTAGHLQRTSALNRKPDNLKMADATTVLLRSLLSKASIYRSQGQLEEALTCVDEARKSGADVTVMQKALLAEISSAS